jgi:ABC-type glycerol-3-phosphate transport system substrate-binding protein
MRDDTNHTRRTLLKRAGVMSASACSSLRFGFTSLARSERVKIRAWTWQANAESEALLGVVDAFNASQGDIEVQLVQRPAIYSQATLTAAMRAGEGPEICIFGRSVLAERTAQGLLEDMTPLMQARGITTDVDQVYAGHAAREVVVDGKIMGLPLDSELRMLLFNRRIFMEEGVDLAEWDPANGPITFDRLGDICLELNEVDASGAYTRVGFVPFLAEGSPYTYLHAWNGDYFDEAACTFSLDSPEITDAATWVQEYCRRCDPARLLTLVQKTALPIGFVASPFLDEQVAVTLARDWELQEIETLRLDFEVGATYIPAVNANSLSASWATGHAASLVKDASHPEEAFRFIDYLTGVEGQTHYCQRMGRLPTRLDIPPENIEKLGRPPFITETAFFNAVPSPALPIATEFNDRLVATWTDIAMGFTPVAEGMESLQINANESLASSGYC